MWKKYIHWTLLVGYEEIQALLDLFTEDVARGLNNLVYFFPAS